MTFDRDQFSQVLTDIETYLGYLKGNELAFDYLKQALAASSGQPTSGNDEGIMTVFLDDGYRFPCPEGKWEVQPSRALFRFNVHVPRGAVSPGTLTPAAWLQEVQNGADQSFRNGAGWASGLSGYASSICAQLTEPDAFALDQDALLLKTGVVDELGKGVSTDWALLAGYLDDWHGSAADEFEKFYNNLSWLLQMYAAYTALIYAGTCAATRIIDRMQTAVMKYVTQVRQQVVDQLDAWADLGMEPTDPPTTPSWLVTTEKVAADAYGLLDHVPVVNIAKGQIDKAVSIVNSVEAIAVDLGYEPPHEEPPLDAMSSEEIYDKLTTTLQKTFNQDYGAALDEVAHGSGRRAVGGEPPFSADEVLSELRATTQSPAWNLDPVSPHSMYSHDSKYRP